MMDGLVVLAALVGVLGVWVSLPLLPAILIYKLFPSTTVAVNGPLAGLTVKAGGAFAAYIVVFAAIYSSANQLAIQAIALQKPTWTVISKLRLIDDKGNDQSELLADNIGLIRIEAKPDVMKVNNDLSSEVRFEIPSMEHVVVVTVPNIGSGVIKLNGHVSNAEIDSYRRTVTFNDPVVIKPIKRSGIGVAGMN